MRFSIITVTYNCEDVIHDCLASVASQTHRDVDHLVIDGGSTDGTLQILERYRHQITTLISEPDRGIYDAMNKGIALATGDLIGFLNSDDFYTNEHVLTDVLNEFLADPSLDACFSDLIYTHKIETDRTIRYWQSSCFEPSAFTKGWCPPHPTFFVRRSVYERFGGFDLAYPRASDIELMIRFLEVQRIRVRYVPRIWVKMRMGGKTNSSVFGIWLQNLEILKALAQHNSPVNPMMFFVHKLFSRGKQFIQRPSED